MAKSRCHFRYLLLSFITLSIISVIRCDLNESKTGKGDRIGKNAICPDSNMCMSKWGYCGTGDAYCGDDCIGGPCLSLNNGNSGAGGNTGNQNSPCPETNMCMSKWGYCGTGDGYCGEGCTGGPCYNNNNNNGGNQNNGNSNTNSSQGISGNGGNSIITEQNFACAFNTIDAGTRLSRLNGLRNSGWTPSNKEEAAVFLAHVYHETDGLKTIREYCAPGCGSHYAGSWCSIQGVPSKLYYGRGWFQLSWPCNYHAAGRALGVDLLNNPDLVEQQQDLAVKTALWYYNSNNMAGPARQGDFAATTRIINGALECNGGSGSSSQMTRVATYRRIRHCFGLGEPNKNPVC